MSESAAYFRHQADKCCRRASAIADPQTQTELRTLAAEYVARALEIESKEQGLGSVGARQEIADCHPGTIGALD
jgi:hypothetical protein